LPYDVVTGLNLKGDEELDFFKFGEKSFIIAKKEDVAAMLSRGISKNYEANKGLSQDEINVLKKLDTLRYNERSREKVERMLNDAEKKILYNLIKKKVVTPFSKDNNEELYSISKNVYDKFLLRKKRQTEEKNVKEAIKEAEAGVERKIGSGLEERYGIENEYVKRLEEKGYIVLQTEAEAASLSIALEESIKQGIVLGTRAFNKKFYILLRQFFEKYAPQIVKGLSGGGMKVEDIARRIGIDEDAARGILYLLAESGDVSEKKKDLFVLT
jgi:hypothetical protein